MAVRLQRLAHTHRRLHRVVQLDALGERLLGHAFGLSGACVGERGERTSSASKACGAQLCVSEATYGEGEGEGEGEGSSSKACSAPSCAFREATYGEGEGEGEGEGSSSKA